MSRLCRSSKAVTNSAHTVSCRIRADAKKVAGQVFNVGCGESITLIQLAAELNQQTGQNLAPNHQPPRTGDIKHSAADISAARAGLNYAPEVTWQKGLEHTLDFYRAGNK